jgi:pantetheine-phosphate adenylyltransferase
MKTALFAGTFDPPTLGHFDIIQRGVKLCDKLYIAVAGDGRSGFLLSQEVRINLLKKLTKDFENVEVIALKGLVVDVAQHLKVNYLIRGLRNSSDYIYEMQMAAMNRQMTGIETLCLITSPQYSHITATLVRQIAANRGKLSGFVPQEIEQSISI